MNDDVYQDQQKLKQYLSDRNLKAIVDYMNAQRKQINDMNVEMKQLKQSISNYAKMVGDMQQELVLLRNEIQISRFNGGSTAS